MIDTIKGTIASITAGIAILGGMVIGFLAWSQPVPTPPAQGHDIATLYVLIGGVIGSAVTFMFTREAATQATRAAQSSNAAGAATATGTTPPPPNPPTSGQ